VVNDITHIISYHIISHCTSIIMMALVWYNCKNIPRQCYN